MATALETEANDEMVENTKPAFLRRVRIRGYKSIAFCDVSLQPLTILVGRNAAGKSNFLDALAFLRDVVDSSVTKAVELHGGWSSLVCRTTDDPTIEIEIEVGFACGPARQRVRIENGENPADSTTEEMPDLTGRNFVAKYLVKIAGGPGAPAIRREKLELTDEKGELAEGTGFDLNRGSVRTPQEWAAIKASKNSSGGIVFVGSADYIGWRGIPGFPPVTEHSAEALSRTRRDQTMLGAIGYSPFLDVGDGLRCMGFYNFHPEIIRQLPKPLPGVLLRKDGGNLASVIEGLKEIDPGSVQRVRDYLVNIAEEVTDFEVAHYGEYETVRFLVNSGSAGSPLKFDAASMSDGTLRVLASLMAAFQMVLPQGYPSVVGIEEPEAALHPAAMRALVDALDEATSRTQILLTTHSADLLDNPTIRPENLLIVQMVEGQTRIGPVDEATIEIIRKKLNTLGGLERENQLEPNLDDMERQLDLNRGKEGTTT